MEQPFPFHRSHVSNRSDGRFGVAILCRDTAALVGEALEAVRDFQSRDRSRLQQAAGEFRTIRATQIDPERTTAVIPRSADSALLRRTADPLNEQPGSAEMKALSSN